MYLCMYVCCAAIGILPPRGSDSAVYLQAVFPSASLSGRQKIVPEEVANSPNRCSG